MSAPGRVAVVGAGVAGLTAAHELGRRGHEVHVYERWPGLGGQAATLDVGDGVLLERYYHHLFTSDDHIAGLYEELGVRDAIEWIPSTVAVFAGGRSRSFSSPLDLLRFAAVSPLTRVRMGLAVLDLKLRHPEVVPFESRTARDWIVKRMGSEAWEKVWGPMMSGKFGDRAPEISMAWLWARLTVRRQVQGAEARGEVLGYPRGGFEHLFRALQDSIEANGGRVLIDRPAARIERAGNGFAITPGAPSSFREGHDPRSFVTDGQPEPYSAVLATVPNPVFKQLLAPGLAEEIGDGYLERLRGIEYHAALCLLLEIDREFSPYYWTNIADPQVDFIGLIEQTNLIPAERYGGRRFLYLANYVTQDNPLLELSPEELLRHYTPGLHRVNPAFSPEWVRASWAFREPDAQPVVTVGYRDRIPALATGVPGLVLANTTQVYPEDRGTNYAVELGRRAARRIQNDVG